MIKMIGEIGDFGIEDVDDDGECYVYNMDTGYGFYVKREQLIPLRDALNQALEHLNARTDHPGRSESELPAVS